MADPKVISADDHMDLHILPKDLWQKRLPTKFRDAGPKVLDTPEGPEWVSEEKGFGRHGARQNDNMPGTFEKEGVRDWTYRPSTPELRIEDMDRDGVYAQVIYPGTRGIPALDPLLRHECIKAYNDWTAEFDSTSSNRLFNLAVLPNHDAEAASSELRRTAKLGHKGAIFYHLSSATPIFDSCWEPLWDAAEEAEMPVSVHLSGGVYSLKSQPGSWMMGAYVTVVGVQLDEVLASMVFSGALERHPGLKLVLGESHLGWVPYVIATMDRVYYQYHGTFKDVQIQTPPSEIFRRQVSVTYLDDAIGVKLFPEIAPDSVMWSSDYPHPVSTWPHSLERLDKSLKDATPEFRRKVTHDNASRLYGIKAA